MRTTNQETIVLQLSIDIPSGQAYWGAVDAELSEHRKDKTIAL